MAEENDESLKQRKLFQDFVAAEMKKRNTTLLSKQDMERIRDYLLGKVVTVDVNLKKRISRSTYILKTFVDQENVLCVLKNVSFIVPTQSDLVSYQLASTYIIWRVAFLVVIVNFFLFIYLHVIFISDAAEKFMTNLVHKDKKIKIEHVFFTANVNI